MMGERTVVDAEWWDRLPLSEAGRTRVPAMPGIYCIYDPADTEPLCVGETSVLSQRARAHCRGVWPCREPHLAYRAVEAGTPKYMLREMESDLLGWHFWHARRPPARQYMD